MSALITTPSRNLRRSLNEIITNIYKFRGPAIDSVLKHFPKIKQFDVSNQTHCLAAWNELDDTTLSKQPVYIGTIKAKKDMSTKYVRLNFFLSPNTPTNYVSAEARLNDLEVHVYSRCVFFEYERLIAVLFHEIKHFLQEQHAGEEYIALVPRLKLNDTGSTVDDTLNTFKTYYLDDAEFEAILVELNLYLFTLFQNMKKKYSSKEIWRVKRQEFLTELQQFLNTTKADVYHEFLQLRDKPSTKWKKVEHFVGSKIPSFIHERFRSPIYVAATSDKNAPWNHLVQMLDSLYKRISHIW